MRWPLALLLLLILPLAADSAPEQEEVRAFTIRSDKRSATVSAENRWLEIAGEADRSGQYRQSLELAFSGSVYHQNFLTYVLASRLGVSEWEGGAWGPAPAYGLIADIHFLAGFLHEKPYPFSLHFDRRDDLQEYSLFDRARVAETALGGAASWNNRWAPLQLSVEQSWKEEQQAARTMLQDELVVRAGLESAGRNLHTRADYTFMDFDRRTVGLFAQQGRSHEVRLANSLAFGGAGRQGLSSNLRFLNLTGTLRQNALDLTELLRLELPWRLAGQASYALRGSWDGLAETVANEARLQASHQLYESLTTTLGLDGSFTAASTFRQVLLGPDLGLQYKKKIRPGTLRLDYRLDTQYEDRRVSALTVSITDEQHVLEDGVVTLLDLPKVIRSSIRVTNESGTEVYLEGIHYSLTEIGDRIQLLRESLASLTVVLVDYSATSDPSFQSFQLAQAGGVHFELLEQRLSLYYRYAGRRYPSAIPALSPEVTDDHRLGLGFNLPPVRASAEYQHHGSSVLPYDVLRGQQSLALPIGGRSLLSLQGSESLVRFAARGLSQGFLEATARYNLSAGQYLALSAAGGCRLQAETGKSTQPLWSAQAGLDFRRGLLTASAEYSFLGPLSGGDHALCIALTRRF